jgi:hypothetical protein
VDHRNPRRQNPAHHPRDYQTAITLHINPGHRQQAPRQAHPAHIRQMHAQVGKRRAAEKAHVILKKALKDAMREGMITHNVAEMVDAPKYKKTGAPACPWSSAKHIIRTA